MRGAAAAVALTVGLIGAWRVAPPAAQRAVLFAQGAYVPESGAPESRLYDPGDGPLSFTLLRREILEPLGLRVDELPTMAPITAAALRPYIAIVLGSNARVFEAAEADALEAYVRGGGRLLTYADYQYGPTNWASDNTLLARFGIEVLPDNFQPRTRIPLDSWGLDEIEVEGISQFRITSAAPAGLQIIARCAPQDRPGCALPPADQTRLQPGDSVACAYAVALPSGGRLAGVCDRNLFHNGPQKDGTDLGQAGNRAFAQHLFAWLTGP